MSYIESLNTNSSNGSKFTSYSIPGHVKGCFIPLTWPGNEEGHGIGSLIPRSCSSGLGTRLAAGTTNCLHPIHIGIVYCTLIVQLTCVHDNTHSACMQHHYQFCPRVFAMSVY